jgi:[phosphatase 2A protein]-leucine-carboxy methyltransferase
LIPAPTPLEIVQYEPLHPSDAFGQTMKGNLTRRGITMPSLEGLPTIAAHEQRLLGVLTEECGGQNYKFEGLTIKQIWDGWISGEEKDRLRRCEMVDEEEEWHLLAGHYGIVRAWRCE